jgi:hypothetical protein
MSEVSARGARRVAASPAASVSLPESAIRPAMHSPASLAEEQSLGELFGRMTSDLSVLFRQEIDLAKVEIKEEATKAGKGAGMLGGTAFTGYMALLLLSFAAAWGLAEVIAPGFAFLVMGALYAVVAGVLFSVGRKELKLVHGPEKTVQTVKEDAQWAREQMS